MEAANPEANIIFGATSSKDFEDEMRVTVIATGFEETKKKPETNRGLFSAAAAQKPVTASEAPRAKVDADIDDIDKIFDIFRK